MHLNGKYFLQNACNIYNFTNTFYNPPTVIRLIDSQVS